MELMTNHHIDEWRRVADHYQRLSERRRASRTPAQIKRRYYLDLTCRTIIVMSIAALISVGLFILRLVLT